MRTQNNLQKLNKQLTITIITNATDYFEIMANKPKTAKAKPGKAQKPRKIKRISMPQADDTLDDFAVKAAHMYYDPCGSELSQSVYGGDRGYVNRFTTNFNAATAAGETAWISIFKPGVNVNAAGAAVSSNTNITLGFADTQAPGAGFLNSNASKLRCLGACYQIRVNSAPNNTTGMIYYGVIPASTVPDGSITSVNDLFPFLTHSVSASQVAMQPLEVKWSPGLFDDKYCPVTGVTADDDSDRNIIVVVGSGFPAATGVNVRATAIYEWTPNRTVNVAVDSTSTKMSKCDFSCVIRNLKRKDAEWWWALGKKTLNGFRQVAQGYYTGGPIGATAAIAKFL